MIVWLSPTVLAGAVRGIFEYFFLSSIILFLFPSLWKVSDVDGNTVSEGHNFDHVDYFSVVCVL